MDGWGGASSLPTAIAGCSVPISPTTSDARGLGNVETLSLARAPSPCATKLAPVPEPMNGGGTMATGLELVELMELTMVKLPPEASPIRYHNTRDCERPTGQHSAPSPPSGQLRSWLWLLYRTGHPVDSSAPLGTLQRPSLSSCHHARASPSSCSAQAIPMGCFDLHHGWELWWFLFFVSKYVASRVGL